MSYRNERAEKVAAEIFGEEDAHLKRDLRHISELAC
jgi:hypothetical protein